MIQKRRKEVLIPGSLLPQPQPGRFHGVITSTKLCENTGRQIAAVSLSDERIKLHIPWIEVQQYVIEQPGSKKKRARLDAHNSEAGKPPLPAKRFASKSGSGELSSSTALAGSSHASGGVQEHSQTLEVLPEKADSTCDSQRYGAQLQARITAILAASSPRWHLGLKLWLKLRGYCPWPALMWSASMCRKKDMEQLLATYKPGMVLVRCYGEHSLMWVREADLEDFDMEDSGKFHQLKAWGRQHNKSRLVDLVLEEVENAIEDADGEVERVLEIEKLSLASSGSGLECCQCQEQGATAACSECERAFHTLCLQPPALKATDLPTESWDCLFCGHTNLVGGGCPEDDKELTVERMGLTPDWIIQAAAFDVFQLEPPTTERPYIKGLLDPCTNSMAAPNIPAEVLYDKQMNGLKLSNSWAGHLILLNPPYTAATQWRFVNRAIDEVENDQVRAVLLLCRNSTDTAYFQRLRPYPRVLLRRTNTRFKDYSKTPIGFGICVFAIAKSSCRELYARFFDAFADMGEPNIPIDKTIMHTDAFHDLLGRLRKHAEEHYRDHWIQCSTCAKWRIITYDAMLAAKDSDWTCRQLRPPFTSCRTPQTKRETLGGRYAALGADGDIPDAIEKVDYSIPRLDLLHKQPTPAAAVGDETSADQEKAAGTEKPADGLDAGGEGAAQASPVVPASRAEVLVESVEKFVKLPMRSVKDRSNPQAPQVLSAIELARQARIAANQAYLAGLKMGPRAIANGQIAAVGNDNDLVLSAARILADKAAVEQARSQVEAAKRHWAKTSVGCEKEASRLAAATQANAEELQLAKSYVSDAETALATLEAQLAAKRRRAAEREAKAESQSHADASDGSSEEEAATEAELLTAGCDVHVSDRTAQLPRSAKQTTSVQTHLAGRSVIDAQADASGPGQAPAIARTPGSSARCWPRLAGYEASAQHPRVSMQLAARGGPTGASPTIIPPHLPTVGSRSLHAGQPHAPDSNRVQAQIWQSIMRQFMLQQAEAAPTQGGRPPPCWQPAALLGAGGGTPFQGTYLQAAAANQMARARQLPNANVQATPAFLAGHAPHANICSQLGASGARPAVAAPALVRASEQHTGGLAEILRASGASSMDGGKGRSVG